MRIIKLYSNNNLFDPVEFKSGLNLILGERTPGDESAIGKKTNGVGKSLCIEFLNYALLKDFDKSRIKNIPDDILPKDSTVLLDIDINGEEFCIERTLDSESIIKINGQLFVNIDDAQKYLTSLLFKHQYPKVNTPSFRQMLGPLMREEESNFVDLIRCYKNQKIADIIPHLYLFNVNISLYKDLDKTLSELAKNAQVKSALNTKITQDGKKKSAT